MNEHNKLNYVELPCRNISKTKAFFEQTFAWSFVDFGPDHTSFSIIKVLTAGSSSPI